MQVDTTSLEDILNKAIAEDSDNKRLEELKSTRRRSITDDVVFEEEFFEKSEVEFRRSVRISN
ncbi:hypothetical protein INT46_004580 [Mucor plumbeus]|uniref:Uncharacterized protein n=1 Tax=Mucor plumbeus TaxID=97098 RepID=A0A8H7R5H3_9FUNG|nr:hypothetical protein INT46_004580 [Mucor plumbeus]